MLAKLDEIESAALAALEGIQDEESLQQWKVAHLGRSAPLMLTFDQMGKLSKEERPLVGRRANEVKRALEAALGERMQITRQKALERSLQSEKLDVTLPGRPQTLGRLHPATRTLNEITRVFGDMGFQVYRSPEVETDENNFQLLNFAVGHPAREMQDTYFVESGRERGDNPIVMRTHTSPGQIHAMREYSARIPTIHLRCGSSCRGCVSATNRSPCAMRCSSTRWKYWQWARISPLAT